MQGTQVPSLGWEDPLEEEMATHSSIFGWKIPWMEEPGGLQSKGSQRIGHNWTTAHVHTGMGSSPWVWASISYSFQSHHSPRISCKWCAQYMLTRGSWGVLSLFVLLICICQLSFFFFFSKVSVAKSCPTLCDCMDCSLPGSSVHGISQARLLEWVAIYFSRGSSQPRDRTWVSCVAGRFFTIWATREALKNIVFFKDDLLI